MTYAPIKLVDLGWYWASHGGVNLGIVGDNRHVFAGTSYHLGKDQLADNAYSVRTARDRAGLSNAASAIDLGKLNGSYANLQKFSTWLVQQARHNAPGTSDMREIIFSPDGKQVLRWDRERGWDSSPRTGEADDTHLTHTHISYYRDSQARDKLTPFKAYFEPAEWKLHISKGATVRWYDLGPDGCLQRPYHDSKPWARSSSADCNGPVLKAPCEGGASVHTALVRSGAYKGKRVRIDPYPPGPHSLYGVFITKVG